MQVAAYRTAWTGRTVLEFRERKSVATMQRLQRIQQHIVDAPSLTSHPVTGAKTKKDVDEAEVVSLPDHLSNLKLERNLQKVLLTIADAVSYIARYLRTAAVAKLDSANVFGDHQLTVDVYADKLIFQRLEECGVVATASSEEEPVEKKFIPKPATSPALYSVSFDPLDGSSIVDANFAVGSIFGIFPGDRLVGRFGRDQCAAVMATYGPRTTMMVATQSGVFEATISNDEHSWMVTHPKVVIKPKSNLFAPANLRMASEDPRYKALVDYWMMNRYTLRYTGGMVPDLNHILVKGHGVFASPVGAKSPAKLRLLYECAPLAYVVVAAGGAACDETGAVAILDKQISSTDTRTGICTGSTLEVQRFQKHMGAQ